MIKSSGSWDWGLVMANRGAFSALGTFLQHPVKYSMRVDALVLVCFNLPYICGPNFVRIKCGHFLPSYVDFLDFEIA